MELIKFEKPLAVEHLLFKVTPELVDKWIEVDHEVWTLELSKQPGFLKKETWVSRDVPGDITTIVYWSDIDLWKSIDHDWLMEVDKKFNQIIGEGNSQLVRAYHTENQFFKVNEYK